MNLFSVIWSFVKSVVNDRKTINLITDIIIVSSSVVIFCSGFFTDKRLFVYIDSFFTLLFLIEAVLKITAGGGWKVYWSRTTNKYDFIITLLALPSFLFFIFPRDFFSYEIVVLFRLFRMLRVLRLFHLFVRRSGGKALIADIKNALKMTLAVIVGFVIVIFMIALVNHSLFKNVAPEFFADPIRSMYHTFRLFTLEGWHEIPDFVSERIDDIRWAGISKFYFCFIIFMCGIIGIAIVTGLFVDSINANEQKRLKDDMDALKTESALLRKQIQEQSELLRRLLYQTHKTK